jgi:hypothetical protein
MAYEIASLYPEVGRSALPCRSFAAAIMELAGPALCRLALRKSGETRKRRAAIEEVSHEPKPWANSRTARR